MKRICFNDLHSNKISREFPSGKRDDFIFKQSTYLMRLNASESF